MSFFGLDRLPQRKLWTSEREYYTFPAADDPYPCESFLYGPRGETVKYLGPRLAGLDSWLPTTPSTLLGLADRTDSSHSL